MPERPVWQKFCELAGLENRSYEDFSDLDYIEKNYLDSVDSIKLISWIEEEYDVKLGAKDVTSKEFRTLRGVNRIIERKVNDSENL